MSGTGLVQRFEINQKGRDFAVGDIHGCFASLSNLMTQANFNPDRDRIFSVGDLVDRGPSSLDALNWIGQPWFHAIRGNHEQMAIEADLGITDPGLHVVNGGLWFYEATEAQRNACGAKFARLPLAIEVATNNSTVGLVHAEVPGDDWPSFCGVLEGPHPANFEHYERFALWGRDIIRGRSEFNGVAGIERVFVGHTPVAALIQIGNVEYIDTGACFGKRLTMICFQGEDMDAIYQSDGPQP